MAHGEVGLVSGPRRALHVLLGLIAIGCTPTIHPSGSRDALLRAGEGGLSAAAFFRHPLLSHVALSPSGEQIGALYSKDGAETVIVRRALGGEIRPIWQLTYEGWTVQTLGWAAEDHLLVGVNIPHPNAIGVRARGSRLMSVPLDGSKWKYLGEDWLWQQFTGAQDRIIDWLPDEPDHVLLSLWQPGKPGASAYRLNVNSGKLTLATQHRPGIMSWFADHRHAIRAGAGLVERRQNYVLYARAARKGRFKKIVEYDAIEADGISFAGFSPDPNVLYVHSEAGTGHNAIYGYDLRTGELGPAVAENMKYDILGIRTSEVDGRPLAAYYEAERPEVIFLDEDAFTEQQRIDASLPGQINRITDESADEQRAIIRSWSDVQPPRYYLLDRREQRMHFLFDSYPEIDPKLLAPMRCVSFRARDGLEIAGYLTLPRNSPERGLPLIVFPHGGPSARDVWGYNPTVQFLASRGFAVFQLNFRGSSGYGKRHRELGYREWGGSMQDDVEDGTRWLVDEGIADPERIGIYGASYGGYAAMMALVKSPDLFHAGASFAGVSDLLMLVDDDSWYDLEELNKPIVGGEWGDRGRLHKLSPTQNADRIQAPVLIAHGTEDWRVHVRQAKAMADSLRNAGKSVELHLYDKEVHGFIDERNEIDFHEKLAAFFDRHLAASSARPREGS